MRVFLSFICVFFGCSLSGGLFADSGDGLDAYKAGDFKRAIPLLQTASTQNRKDASLRAALLSSLVYEGRVDDASDTANQAATDFPNAPEVLAARGEFSFYMGDMPEAEKIFKAAIALSEQTPRAYYGLFRLYRAASMYRSARLFCLKAHELDPNDALITRAWMGYLAVANRKELFDSFVAAHPWLYPNTQRDQRTEEEVSHELNGRMIFELDGEPSKVTLHLVQLLYGPTRLRGFGLEFRINGSRPLRMLLDSGASGILIKESAVDKAELSHLGSDDARGIGDKGPRSMFGAIADTCQIGLLKFKACLVRAVEGKGRIAGDEDGLLGPDIFAGYLVELDFEKRLLQLTPQPHREPNPQGYDRAPGPDEAGFYPVFRAGSHLFVSTKVNDKSRGLFLLDTGASISNIDSTFARLSTKVHGDSYTRITGVSGQVKEVFEADKAMIEFARFRQPNLGLTAFNLNNSPEHQEFRMAGILGLPVLNLFRLTLDYRNGLVKFEYLKH